MTEKWLHIVSFNVPWPANYGGVIDVFHKLETLHRMGVKIILHCFVYDRPPAPELHTLCHRVFYYRRQTGWAANISLLPYNVNGRKSPALLQNLLADNHPILFEGLHSCYWMNHPGLRGRIKIYRESNIEHHYYFRLAQAGGGLLKRSFFLIEALRFKIYQRVIATANLTLAVSLADTRYLGLRFPGQRIETLPSFHAHQQVTALPGKGSFILYHGKLSVTENQKAALFLIRKVLGKLPHRCVIAGMDPSEKILRTASRYPNILIQANPTAQEMDRLIRQAHVHLLITFQNTGLKLKLLHSLFAGRHVVANPCMTNGSGLSALCHTAHTPQEMITLCNRLMERPFEEEDIRRREAQLLPAFANKQLGERLLELVYGK